MFFSLDNDAFVAGIYGAFFLAMILLGIGLGSFVLYHNKKKKRNRNVSSGRHCCCAPRPRPSRPRPSRPHPARPHHTNVNTLNPFEAIYRAVFPRRNRPRLNSSAREVSFELSTLNQHPQSSTSNNSTNAIGRRVPRRKAPVPPAVRSSNEASGSSAPEATQPYNNPFLHCTIPHPSSSGAAVARSDLQEAPPPSYVEAMMYYAPGATTKTTSQSPPV